MSSNDVEFAKLLKSGAGEGDAVKNPFETKQLGGCRVLFGGFPVTFDRSPASAPLAEMQLTRALLLAGLEQAISMDKSETGPAKLDSGVQWRIHQKWLAEMDPKNGAIDSGMAHWKRLRDEEELEGMVEMIGSPDQLTELNDRKFREALAVGN